MDTSGNNNMSIWQCDLESSRSQRQVQDRVSTKPWEIISKPPQTFSGHFFVKN